MYQVRFHLGSGRHFKHWQVRSEDGVSYYHPEDHTLLLEDCVLHVNTSGAEEVLKTQRRDVCGWVRCRNFRAVPPRPNRGRTMVHFDPKVDPHWRVAGNSDVWDGMNIPSLFSHGKRLFLD